jgi:hypothetical protein
LYTDPSGDICEGCSGSPGVNNGGGTATSTDLKQFAKDTGLDKWINKNFNFKNWSLRNIFGGGNNKNHDPAPQPNVSKYVNVKTTGSGQYYGGDGSGSLLDYFSRFVYETDQFNPIALAWDGIKGNVNGTDRYGNELSGFDANMKIVTAIPMTKVGGVLVNVGERALLTEAKTSVKSILTGGKTFEQYKIARGGTETLTKISTSTGTQRISTEFHHVFLTQRFQRAYDIPMWMVNNRINVWKVNTIQHSLIDSYRYNFLRAGIKPEVGWFAKYNWFTKF